MIDSQMSSMDADTGDVNAGALVLVVDFGSQYTHLIARRVRDLGHAAAVVPYQHLRATLDTSHYRALILSGGHPSVLGEHKNAIVDAARCALESGLPVMGICLGWQAMTLCLSEHSSSADVSLSSSSISGVDANAKSQYGRAQANIVEVGRINGQAPHWQRDTLADVWMSHNDSVVATPPDFRVIAYSGDTHHVVAMAEHQHHPWLGVQFHPEVSHTVYGLELLRSFVEDIAQCPRNWEMTDWISHTLVSLHEKVGERRVLCALSGGVDSLVAARLLETALGDKVTCVMVDNGLLRLNEAAMLKRELNKVLESPLIVLDEAPRFYQALAGVEDPEQKRKAIGAAFIDCFEAFTKDQQPFELLAQGTLYPDVVESAPHGNATLIKSHHNVGGLPELMRLDLVEPLRELYKDEVRKIGALLNIPSHLLQRHPFPGPGLAVRILGAVTPEKIDILQRIDAIFINLLRVHGLYDEIWQAFAVLLPVRAVGVVGDQRRYQYVAALRAVTSIDGMTADVYAFPPDILNQIATEIVNEVQEIGRVVYDITAKPPGTIEWE